MTRWQEFPLRQQGQPWPGLNTRGGKLDPGMGYLEEGSVNAVINEADILEKRKGIVRGLDERFDGVVCGLFRYTDDCGREYLVVADQLGIKVRTPFDIPSFLGTDSLPFDDFETLNAARWSNTADYDVEMGALQLDPVARLLNADFVAASRFMQWFKSSVLSSYFIEVQYRLVAGDSKQIAAVVLKRSENGQSYVMAQVLLDGSTYRAQIQAVIGGVRSTLASADLSGASLGDGFLRLSYDAGTFRATARVIPSGGQQQTIVGQLTELQDSSLGQLSAVGLAGDSPQLESVSGGQL